MSKYTSYGTLPFGSAKIRYDHRFSPFLCLLQPIPISYDDFVKNSAFPQHDAEQLLQSAEQHFVACQRAIEKHLSQGVIDFSAQEKQFVESMLSVCKANLISIKLTRMTKEKPCIAPSFDFSFSKQYPVIKTV